MVFMPGATRLHKKAPRHYVGGLIEDLMKVKGIGIRIDLQGNDNIKLELAVLSINLVLNGFFPVKATILRNSRKNDLVKGRRLGDHRLPKGKVLTGF